MKDVTNNPISQDLNLWFYKDGNIVTENIFQKFKRKKVVVFGLPGAFTPTCTSQMLPQYESRYEDILACGIDEVYCHSVNDPYVMDAWFKSLDIKKVKPLPDGNGEWAGFMGTLCPLISKGYGARSWRYTSVINDRRIQWKSQEDGIDTPEDGGDPYTCSDPDTLIRYLRAL